MRLNNVVNLNLRNNLLTTISNLNRLHKLEVLLLGDNQIITVPGALFSNKPLQMVNLHDNIFLCDCDIEGFQKWVLTDVVAYVWNNFLNLTAINAQNHNLVRD